MCNCAHSGQTARSVGWPTKGFELRAVHQFKTLVGRSLLTVGTLNAQPTFGKLWSVWPQFVVKKTVGLRLYFAVTETFVAIPTTQDPVGHTFSLGACRHCYGTECSSSGIAFTYPQVGTSSGTNRVAKTRQSGAMTRYAYTDSVESLSATNSDGFNWRVRYRVLHTENSQNNKIN
jgi:hypothetical protein